MDEKLVPVFDGGAIGLTEALGEGKYYCGLPDQEGNLTGTLDSGLITIKSYDDMPEFVFF